MRDVPFEAAVLRDAVLVGLVHEHAVIDWATRRLEADLGPAGALADLLSVPPHLSPIREALRAFGTVQPPERVTAALFSMAALDPSPRQRGDADLLRVLSDIRRLAGCPRAAGEAIANFEARGMMAAAGHETPAPSAAEMRAWLDAVRPPAHFLITCDGRTQAASFVDALSRGLAGHAPGAGAITFAGREGRTWLVALDERALDEARRRFGPLAVASTLPYPGRPHGPSLVEEAPRGVEAIEARLAALDVREG